MESFPEISVSSRDALTCSAASESHVVSSEFCLEFVSFFGMPTRNLLRFSGAAMRWRCVVDARRRRRSSSLAARRGGGTAWGR